MNEIKSGNIFLKNCDVILFVISGDQEFLTILKRNLEKREFSTHHPYQITDLFDFGRPIQQTIK